MIIKILGTWCPTCKLLQKTVEDAAKKLEIDCEIIKIEDMQEIAEYDVMAMPALVINDVLVLAWGVPDAEDMLAILQHFQDHKDGGCCCCEEEDNEEHDDDEEEHECCGSWGCGSDGGCCGGCNH